MTQYVGHLLDRVAGTAVLVWSAVLVVETREVL